MSTEPVNVTNQNENGRNPTILIGGFIVLVLLLGFLVFGNNLFGEKAVEQAAAPDIELPTSGGPLLVGDTAIEFTLQDLDGNTVNLSDHLGHPIVVNFWASWCAPCRIEMPELQATFEQYQDQGLVILALNQEEPADAAADFFFEEMGLTFTNPLLDAEALVADEYGVRNLPTTFFISPEGEVTAIHRGPALQSQFDGYLAQTIPGLSQ
ncbi:MAG: TlpA disulfide reductase family protein [Anaerolineae bacterium]